MNREIPKLAIISPCYNEELVIAESAKKLLSVLDDLIGKSMIHPESFVYFVNDGSTDATWSLLESLHKEDERIRGLRLSRNFGQQNAILAGLLSVKGRADCFISIDADLQDDVTIIEKFIDGFAQGYDIIYGVKKNARRDSLYKKYGTWLFYFIRKAIGVPVVKGHGDFRFINRRALDSLSEFGEVNIFLGGIFPLLGYKTKTIPYVIHERTAGESKYSFGSLLSLALDGITSFTIVPLRLILLGGLSFLIGAVLLLILIALHIIIPNTVIWILSIFLFLGGLQTICLGVVGEYIGNIYKETKRRPRFIKEAELWQ